MFNTDVRNKFKEAVRAREGAAKKHEIKIISAYTTLLDHSVYYIVEAPSQQAVENYFVEIGFAFWNDVGIRQAKLVEDVIKKIMG